jgi:LemA protein
MSTAPILLILAIPAILLVVLLIWAVGIYNALVKLRNRFKNAFAQIDVQLKRRHDLIPNLVETAKSFMKHERETLEAVIKARNAATDARSATDLADGASVQALASAESGLGSVLGRLFALQESYPDLKSDQNMMQLSEELSSTENKIAFSRQAYNDSVMTYNNKREMFPSNIIAGMMNFAPATLFEITDEAERENVEVKFN